MPRVDPAEFGRVIAHLTPHELRPLEGMVAGERARSDAVTEIDSRADMRGPAASCPRCEGGAFGAAGHGQARNDGAARAAGRVNGGAATRRSPGCTGPI